MRVSEMLSKSYNLSVALEETPEMLSCDREQFLIRCNFGGVFNESRIFRKQRIRRSQKRLDSMQRTFEPFDGDIPISDIIRSDSNNFRRPEPMTKPDQEH